MDYSIELTKEEIKALPREAKINYYAYHTDTVSISNHNQKTGPLCNDLAMPTCTCREDAPCRKNGCYCMKGTQQFPVVLGAYYRNLRLYNTNPEDFWEQVEFFIKHRPLPLFRWHDAGEFVDYDYFLKTVELAQKFPKIKFLAYTKKYDLVNRYLDEGNELPKNYTIRFSMWHKLWEVPNPHNLPVAYVDFTDETINPDFPERVASCPNQKDDTITCSICQKCWNKKVPAVVFHQH